MKIFVACVLLAVVLAEPPVDNRYLPPQQGLSPPSQSYGFPGSGGQRQTDAFLRPRPSYGAPAVNQRPSGRRPSNQYIPPQSPSNQYGPPRNQYLPPSNQYAAPRNQYESNRNAPPSNQYIPPSNQYAPPSNQYIPPSNRNAPPSNQYIPPSNQYAPPSNQYIPPSNQYIPPPNRAEPFGTYNGGPDSAETRNSGENLYPKADTRGIDGFIELNEATAIGNYPQRGGYAGDDEGNNAGNNNPFKGTLYGGSSYYPNAPGGYGDDENRNAGNSQAFKGTLYAGNSYYPNAPGHPDGADYKDRSYLNAVPDQDFWMNDGPFQGGGDAINSSPYLRGAPSGERDGLNFGGDAIEGPNVFKDAINIMDIFFGGHGDDIAMPSPKSRRSGPNGYSNDHRQGGFGENDHIVDYLAGNKPMNAQDEFKDRDP